METMEISQSLFTEMVEERIHDFGLEYIYDREFWDKVVEYFEEIGWESIPLNNREPKIIIDNIAINGEINSVEEIMKEYELSTEEEVEEKANEEGWLRMADLYVISWGL